MGMPKTKPEPENRAQLLQEIAQLKAQLETAQETLSAIRKGEVDALVVNGEEGEQIFTLSGEQEPYRIFVETMNEGAAMVVPGGTIVYSNQRFADLVKMPLEKLIGAPFQQFVSQYDCSVLQELEKSSGQSGYRRECTLRASNGTRVPVYLSARAINAGSVQSLCIVATDLTERKLAEKRVVESERRLRLVFDQIPAAVWTTDRDLRILSGSAESRADSNHSPKNRIGMTMQEFFDDPRGKTTPIRAHLAALRGEQNSYEYNLDGTIYSVNVQPLRDAEGEITGVIGVALDVTENKRYLASVAKLAAIVESTQDAIYGATLSGYITSWNRGAEQMYGYPAEEAIGQNVSITVPEGREQEPADVLGRIRRGEVVRPFETVRRCKDGSLIDVSMAVSAVKDDKGRIMGVSAIAHDLSDRKQIEKELRKLSGRLLNLQDEARRDMARELHDSVIQGLAVAMINLSMLKDKVQLKPEARKTLEDALKITEESVREIRTFSYLLHPPLLDVMGLQSALRWLVEGYNKRSGVQVKLDLPEGQERLDKDVELALFRIVQEALTNIQRHSGGHQATIRMNQVENALTLTIADDGHGMDAQTLAKVRQEGAALGVGIAGMKERMRQLGGRLEISSGSNGTAVTVSFPFAR